ncbi:hypothetical protein AAFF_G00362710 [Aldrovandia affinis]|uniref:Uncharacterized protein n=1 Tax=Aldrovandia affinis TaxID=143900 RepID=A0AAD7WN23_9TELE|nr:hypothetical protein AAFF_G00362710 [Aldrovandia affinis]
METAHTAQDQILTVAGSPADRQCHPRIEGLSADSLSMIPQSTGSQCWVRCLCCSPRTLCLFIPFFRRTAGGGVWTKTLGTVLLDCDECGLGDRAEL